ncbi:MAG: substrate-binding domain-containing protein, partial [Syntrophales bacterium]|nr:substrate-binding domain-containing protein [Syntrophales bacterium]
IFMVLVLSSLSLAQEIKVAAGVAPSENIFDNIKGPFEKASGLKLTVVTKGSSDSLKDLDKGLVEAAVGGVSFPDWMDMMVKEGYKIPDKEAYKYRVIGKDIVKVFVNKGNAVKKLSKEQLKGVFTGKIANWKEVGGKDMEIVIISGGQIHRGAHAVFQKQVMDGESFTKKLREVATSEELKKQISQTQGGIGIGPAGILDASLVAPEIPEVGRPITLITKGAPSANISKMLDFIRGEGQKYLAK